MCLLLLILAIAIVKQHEAYNFECPYNDAICGTDGNTYINICEFRRAKKLDSDLAVMYDGPCLAPVMVSGKTQTRQRWTKAGTKLTNVGTFERIPVYAADEEVFKDYKDCHKKCPNQCSKIVDDNGLMYFTGQCLTCCFGKSVKNK